MPVLVIGVGNEYRRDDGAGLAAARRLGAAAGVPVMLHDGRDGTALLDAWRGAATVILFDAAQSGAAAGTMHRLDAGGEDEPSEVRRGLGAGHAPGASTHGLGVAEAIALARALRCLPRRLIIIGIEGSRFDDGVGLSPAVEQVMDEAVALGLDEIPEAYFDVRRAAR